MKKTKILSKEQLCYLCGFDEPWLYESKEEVLKWWKLKIKFK